MNIIDIEHLTKTYGNHRGVTDLSLSIPQGEIFGFLGPNGAGKSTTIRSILGMIRYQSGSIKVFGKDAKKEHTTILKSIGYMPSEAMFYPTMYVKDVIQLAAKTRGLNCDKEAKKLCDCLEVPLNKKINELSLGNRKKVSIVCAMQHKPQLFIFDEPTSGLDPLMQDTFFQLILEYNKAGTTCFLSSHVLSEVKKYCSSAAIIKDGSLIKVDTVANLTKTNVHNIQIHGLTQPIILPQMEASTFKDQIQSFTYKGNINELIHTLSTLNITDLYISEPSLEEIFMHFYEKEA